MNTTSFIGRLTKDPEVHATASGPVADMRSWRKLQQMKEGSSMTHANHEINPGFDPRQIWKDGCTECGNRSRLLPMSILELDPERFRQAWARAFAWEHDDDTTLNLSQAEMPLLKQLWALQMVLERFFGWPIGVLPDNPSQHQP